MAEGKRKVFLFEFFGKNSKVGSVTPSSRFLAYKMLKNIEFKKDITIAEYGPGTGVFTDKIIEKMSINSKIFIFELNKEFYQILHDKYKDDQRVHIICDSAENILQYLKKENIQEVDYIVSSLPLSLLPENTRIRIIKISYDMLKKDGILTQFQYSRQCEKLFEHYFKNIKNSFTLLNFPPAFVYTCKK